jgi:hypothetical protein
MGNRRRCVDSVKVDRRPQCGIRFDDVRKFQDTLRYPDYRPTILYALSRRRSRFHHTITFSINGWTSRKICFSTAECRLQKSPIWPDFQARVISPP